jgi:hypothetical protein
LGLKFIFLHKGTLSIISDDGFCLFSLPDGVLGLLLACSALFLVLFILNGWYIRSISNI